MLIYQLKPEGVVNNWLLAHLRMHFNVLLFQRYVEVENICKQGFMVHKQRLPSGSGRFMDHKSRGLSITITHLKLLDKYCL